MKIIAITEVSNYDGDAKKVLVEMTHEELAKLSGLDHYRDMKTHREDSKIKIGTKINIQKAWDDMQGLRSCFNQLQSMANSCVEISDKLKKIDLPDIFVRE